MTASKPPGTDATPDALTTANPGSVEPGAAKDKIADTDLDQVAGGGDDLTIMIKPKCNVAVN